MFVFSPENESFEIRLCLSYTRRNMLSTRRTLDFIRKSYRNSANGTY